MRDRKRERRRMDEEEEEEGGVAVVAVPPRSRWFLLLVRTVAPPSCGLGAWPRTFTPQGAVAPMLASPTCPPHHPAPSQGIPEVNPSTLDPWSPW
eukprot:2611772-Pyramimonas_sp.AAC.1